MTFAREGHFYIALAAALSLLAIASGTWWIAVPMLVLTALVINFFRDPERVVPVGEQLVTAPADGKVVAIVEHLVEERFLGKPCTRVSIFMSPLNVHVNRIPVDGTVVAVEHTAGRFHAAFLDKASEYNERNAVVVEDPRGERVLFVQIAGQLARRIVCHVTSGDHVRRGERYGMIIFGSRLDLYLPEMVKLAVAIGDRVTAGETIIGSYP
jgi:phosphatidylserine decarboxylase